MLQRFDSYAANPHAISTVPETGSKNILVCFPDFLAVVAIDSGKIIRKFVANDPTQRLAHIEHGLRGETIVLASVSAGFDRLSTSGKIFRAEAASDTLIQLQYPKPLHGEALSSAIDPKNVSMLVTHQDCDMVSLWDLNEFKCISTLPLPSRPRGVAFDPESKKFIVTNIESRIFHLAGDREIVQTQSYAHNSSHFIRTQFKV